MPYLQTTHSEAEAIKSAGTMSAPFGPGFSEDQVKKADKMEVWCSSFSDPGEDYTQFKLFDGDKVIASRTLGGY